MEMIKIFESPLIPESSHVIEKDDYGIFKDFSKSLNDIADLNIFFYNLQTLKMKPVTIKKMSSPSTLAEYSVLFNYIRFLPKLFKIAISHELLHVSSSFLTDECQYSGFSQFHRIKKILIGVGINEGYTCILDERYFKDYVPGKEGYLKDTYMIIKQVASMLEDLVGKENMEKWYFSADLKSLVDYLCQFMDYDSIICFLLAVDNIFYYCDEGTVLKPRVAMENYKYAVEFIGRCYINIFSGLLASKEIDQEKFEELMGYVYTIMSKELKFRKFSIFKSRKMSHRKFQKIVEYEQNKVLKKYI